MACEDCQDPLPVYFRTSSLAINLDRHSALHRCPWCGAWYEVVPEEREAPKEITEATAKKLFADAF
jgi:hypothetical protein